MKKLCVMLGMCLLLTGCAATEVFETLGQIPHEANVSPAMGSIQLVLPDDAAVATLSNNGDKLYECDGYTLMLQTLSSGDIQKTVENISGFSAEDLTVMESRVGGNKRYEWVWTAAGEGGDVLCRATILDDGNYHYCLCAMAPAENMGTLQEKWNDVFRSFQLN